VPATLSSLLIFGGTMNTVEVQTWVQSSLWTVFARGIILSAPARRRFFRSWDPPQSGRQTLADRSSTSFLPLIGGAKLSLPYASRTHLRNQAKLWKKLSLPNQLRPTTANEPAPLLMAMSLRNQSTTARDNTNVRSASLTRVPGHRSRLQRKIVVRLFVLRGSCQ